MATYELGDRPDWIALRDLNGDDVLDIISAKNALAHDTTPEDARLVTWLGRGDGTFDAPVRSLTGHFVYYEAFGDLNADGYLDLVALKGLDSEPELAPSLDVLLGAADGSFTPGASYFTPRQLGRPLPKDVAIGDLDGDGLLDVLWRANEVVALLGAGDGTFCSSRYPFVRLASFALGDIDGDNRSDLVIPRSSSADVLLSKQPPRGQCEPQRND